MHPDYWSVIMGVSLHSVSNYFWIRWVTFQANKSPRSISVSNAAIKSDIEAMTSVPQIINYAVVEKRMEQKEKQK